MITDTDDEPIPDAEIIGERRYGGLRTVRTLCPSCGRTHVHRRPAEPATAVTAPCGTTYTLATERKP